MGNHLTSCKEESFPEWTIEEFDAIHEDHTFSWRYQIARNKAIKEYRRKNASLSRLPFRTAASVAAACILLPVGVNAAVTHADFFRNVFGDAGRESVTAHKEQIDDGKGGKVEVTYPEREYVPVDEDVAENMIGEAISTEPVSVEINDHKLTILSAVRDTNAMTMEFTIECETGVKVYDIDELANESKGPRMAEDATFEFMVENAGEHVYIDREKSTETCLHCYDYCVFMEPMADGIEPTLTICYADIPILSLAEDDMLQEKQVSIPAAKAVAETVYSSGEGGNLELSPISCRIDLGKGLGLSREEAYDPWNMKTVSIYFKDGSVYEVYDRDGNIDNTTYACGGLGENQTEITLNLNRLVEADQVDYIMINDVRYSAAE